MGNFIEPNHRKREVSVDDAAALAVLVCEELAERECVEIDDISIKISTRKTSSRLATAWPVQGRITVYLPIHLEDKYRTYEEVLTYLEDTLRHEIAHIHAWRTEEETGHGGAWKNIAEMFGAHPTASAHMSDVLSYANTRKEIK